MEFLRRVISKQGAREDLLSNDENPLKNGEILSNNFDEEEVHALIYFEDKLNKKL